MIDFNARAREWDIEKVHIERSNAIAAILKKRIPLNNSMKALEYGAGTGILSFMLIDRFSEIVLMDNSKEMIKVCEEKKEYFHAKHIKPVRFDLEKDDFYEKFDIIYCQMVLHHVKDVEMILGKLYCMLNPKGYLAIGELYTEDGSFHGPDVQVHHGFNPVWLIESLKKKGFNHIEFETCFVNKRPTGREYPVFLMVANKS